MTVAFPHELYMTAMREGRASRAKRINKEHTIADKLEIYACDIGPTLGRRVFFDITEAGLTTSPKPVVRTIFFATEVVL